MLYAELRQPWIPHAIAAIGKISSGRTRFSWHLAFTRLDRPGPFWGLILLKLAVAMFVAVAYFMNYTG
jgi:hypothetical protein